jgi:hypothetical protein
MAVSTGPGLRGSLASRCSMTTQRPMIAQELRRQADEFIDVKALPDKISRDPVQRPARDRTTSQSPQRTIGSQIEADEHEFDED